MLLSAGTSVVWQWNSDVYTVFMHTKHARESYTLVACNYDGTTVLCPLPLFHIGLVWDHMLIILSTTLLCIASSGVCHVGVCTWLYVTRS